ncbi:hypothetical protein [Ligilactobacillus animalis]|uniref:hypothetical protein n=1 Tax=Ligilactobacillus animalis TaxID=1605 RepID=UPI000219451E|nr:hypothetical protein [Ligilactobacillus animalis]
MLQENAQLNQDKITSFERLKVSLRSLIATDDLEPEQARSLFNAYGDKLKNDDPKLYSKLSDIVLVNAVVYSLKNKIKHVPLEACEVKVALKYFSKHLRAHEPELYTQLIELDRKEA